MELSDALLWAAALSAVALVMSVVMVWRGSGKKSLPGCKAGSSCDEVTASRWSKAGRLPVAFAGALVYGAMLVCELLVGRVEIGGSLWMGLACMAAIAFTAGVWFSGLQLFVLRRLCAYCTLIHLCGVASAALVWISWDHSNRKPGDATEQAAFAGVGAMVCLAAVQILVRPRTYLVEHTSNVGGGMDSKAAVSLETGEQFLHGPEAHVTGADVTTKTSTKKSREMQLLSGQVVFDAARFPVIGAMNARFMIADVLDYTCEHCREVFPLVKQAMEHFDGELSVAILCTPQEDMFEPGMPIDPRYVNGRAFAQLALVVWQENPRRFAEFHHWLLETGWRYPLETARGMAIEFVGELTLERALRDGNIRKSLDESMALYHQSGAGRLPKLLLPKALVWGKVDSIDKLIWVLEKELRGVDV